MALDLEWRDRLRMWRGELKRHFYQPLGTIDLSGFVTHDALTPEQAAAGAFEAMPPGTAWGAKWEYGWFRGKVSVPAGAAGRRLCTVLEVTGAEALVYANGRMIESHRRPWPHLTLMHNAEPGTTFNLLIEAYAWHGPTPCAGGPLPPGRRSVPEPPPAQQRIGNCTFGIWHETAYQLDLDVTTLFEIREALESSSLRVAEIDAALRDFTLLVDFELPDEERIASFEAARERLAPLLACRNGSTAPEMFCCGHAHLDVAWLWPLAETRRKAARTLANQLALAAEYPEHVFMHSQAHLYQMVKESYPELYERVKEAVATGTVVADGGMWVEADTNVSGGEALIRQFVYGKRFFREEFGIDSRLLWLPDVFGYSAAMPQIMRGCGVEFFTTSKIFWTLHGGDPFPYHHFTWEGLDGSTVVAHLYKDYNSGCQPSRVIGLWRDRVQPDNMATRLYPFGFGDGGGGPTRDHLEYIRRLADCEGVPRLRLATPEAFFEDLVARGDHLANRYVGELYFQLHRGVQTSQARTKRLNRRSELALRDAEMWGAAAGALAELEWPATEAAEAWRKVLLNQFHDILPGSSIQRVYEEANALYQEAIDTARNISETARRKLVRNEDAVTVFNSLNWPRRALVALPDGWAGACAADGAALPVQSDGEQRMVEAELPSCGWTALRSSAEPAPAVESPSEATDDGVLQNGELRVTLNRRGEIESLEDRRTGRQLLSGKGNVLRMYKDIPGNFEAWDIDTSYKQLPVPLDSDDATLEVVASGPLVATIRVTRQVHDSRLQQDISLRRGSRLLEFHTRIDWQECHKLLKVCFETDVHANEALHDIQFGYVARPNHASRPFDADRFEVSNHKWTALAEPGRGFAVLNDCKYGINVAGSSINLSLLRAPKAPDETADLGEHEFTYACYAWDGPLSESLLWRQAYELNIGPDVVAGAAPHRSLVACDATNIIVEVLKPAEDGSGDLVLRLYECLGTRASTLLAIGLPIAAVEACDMLETPGDAVAVTDGAVELQFRPFEIKTLRLRLQP